MLCHVILCYVMLCYLMLCYVMLTLDLNSGSMKTGVVVVGILLTYLWVSPQTRNLLDDHSMHPTLDQPKEWKIQVLFSNTTNNSMYLSRLKSSSKALTKAWREMSR